MTATRAAGRWSVVVRENETAGPPNVSREHTIELALEAMKWVMSDRSIPQPVRYLVARAHTELHRCRANGKS